MIGEPVRHCKRLRTMLLVSAWMLTAAIAAFAQTAPVAGDSPAQDKSDSAQLPAFEVISIKPDKSGSGMIRIMFTPDGISITGLPVHMLVREAFNISDDQLLGEPGWLNSDHFDIEAKVAAEDVPKLKTLKPTERWAMLLPVLQDRFALKFHHETRDLTQYVLVVAKGGLKMKEATPGDSYANGIMGPGGRPGGAGIMRMQPGELMAQANPIGNLVRQLSFQFGATVVDKTGLTGKYDFDLKWAPDEGEGLMPRAPDGSQPGTNNPAPPPTTGPSLFTALEEQLGLKLESQKEPADVIVIDHIEQPSPN